MAVNRFTVTYFYSGVPRNAEVLYKAYSDEELLRLNAAITEMNGQVTRVLTLHQLLGTRISDTLTSLELCLSKKGGKDLITIRQVSRP